MWKLFGFFLGGGGLWESSNLVMLLSQLQGRVTDEVER